MACGQSFYEDNPRKELEREERRKRLNKEAAEKIHSFFSSHGAVRAVVLAQKSHPNDHDCKKILIKKGEDTLTINHRGYEIQVSGDPTTLVSQFDQWHRGNMSHARIIPQDH